MRDSGAATCEINVQRSIKNDAFCKGTEIGGICTEVFLNLEVETQIVKICVLCQKNCAQVVLVCI